MRNHSPARSHSRASHELVDVLYAMLGRRLVMPTRELLRDLIGAYESRNTK